MNRVDKNACRREIGECGRIEDFELHLSEGSPFDRAFLSRPCPNMNFGHHSDLVSFDILDSWRGIYLKLPPTFSQQVFNGTEIFLVQANAPIEFSSTHQLNQLAIHGAVILVS